MIIPIIRALTSSGLLSYCTGQYLLEIQ